MPAMSRRLAASLALVATVALGVVSRKVHAGAWLWDKALGDVLYAIAWYLAIVVASGAHARAAGPLALAISAAVEVFKLTGLPRAWAAVPPVRWVLGRDFDARNLACYALGACAIAAADVSVRPAAGGPPAPSAGPE